MRIGRLSQRVRVERPVSTQDADGHTTITWQTVATMWANVKPLRTRERLVADQILADVEVIVYMRRDPPVHAIDATWRLLHGSAVYNIVGVADLDSAGRELEISCVVGTNDG